MLKRISYHLTRLFYGIIKPKMIYYTKNFQGNTVRNLRIGTSTFIDYPNNLNLADNIYIGHHNFIEASNGITIQEGCQITSFISITSHSSHNAIRLYGSSYGSQSEQIGYVKGDISIGKFCFVGPHTTIVANTHIEEGCIIAAYSYVKGDFPAYSIIAGNPAKVIGSTKDINEKFLTMHPELHKTYMK